VLAAEIVSRAGNLPVGQADAVTRRISGYRRYVAEERAESMRSALLPQSLATML
jgi:hypothetical protein